MAFTFLNSTIRALLSVSPLLLPQGAPTPDLPRGQVVEDLAVAADPGQTYALYVPRSGDPAQPAPILYLLDPRGRARLPIERFRAAAEATGAVLASSYRSRSDEPGDPNLPALRAMWADTHARLAIDDRRVYVAGFSGTARAAWLMADLAAGRVAGVIAAGAGFPAGRPPRRDTPFLFFAAVGDTDFNYCEMQELERTLAQLGLPYRLEVFEGDHDWMPEEAATAALRWMELRVLGHRLRAPDQARAAALEAAKRPFEARRQWSWMARDYDPLRDVTEARAHVAHLAGAAQREARERMAREARERGQLSAAQEILARATQAEPWLLGRVVSDLQVERLRQRAVGESDEGRSARRILNAVFVQTAVYLPRDARQRGDHEAAARFLSVAAALRPEDAQVWYRLAAAQSRAGRRRPAVDSLRRALEAGFTDGPRLDGDADFDRVREDADFRGLAARLAH